MNTATKKSGLAKQQKINRKVRKAISVRMMEKELGIDNIDPIHLSSSESDENFEIDNEYFKDMYEDEIRKLYKKI